MRDERQDQLIGYVHLDNLCFVNHSQLSTTCTLLLYLSKQHDRFAYMYVHTYVRTYVCAVGFIQRICRLLRLVPILISLCMFARIPDDLLEMIWDLALHMMQSFGPMELLVSRHRSREVKMST